MGAILLSVVSLALPGWTLMMDAWTHRSRRWANFPRAPRFSQQAFGLFQREARWRLAPDASPGWSNKYHSRVAATEVTDRNNRNPFRFLAIFHTTRETEDMKTLIPVNGAELSLRGKGVTAAVLAEDRGKLAIAPEKPVPVKEVGRFLVIKSSRKKFDAVAAIRASRNER